MKTYHSGTIPKDDVTRGFVLGFRMRQHQHHIYAIEAAEQGDHQVVIQLHSQRSRKTGRGGTLMYLNPSEAHHLMQALRRVMEKPPMLVEL